MPDVDIDNPTIEVNAQTYKDLLASERASLIGGVQRAFEKNLFFNDEAASDFIRHIAEGLETIQNELLRVEPLLKTAQDLRNLRSKLQGD